MVLPTRVLAAAAGLAALVGVSLCLGGCDGPGLVEFVDGQCTVDGVVAERSQVEGRQTAVTRRMAARQPFFVAITILVIAVGAGSTVQNAWRVVSVSGGDPRAFAERLRARLDRYREHKLRYFATVGASLALLVAAGAAYVYLDLDKRASERALATLQFCHLAQRSNEEHDQLAEQRRNLEAIQTTATSIRDLVDTLPPEQRAQARVAVDRLGRALGRQSSLVGDTAKRVEETARTVQATAAARNRKRGKGAPAAAPGLPETPALAPGRVSRQLDHLSEQLDALDARASGDSARVVAIDAALRRLAEQSGCPCPACPAGAAGAAGAVPATAGAPPAAPR